MSVFPLSVSIVTTHQEVRDGENSSTSPVVMGRTLLNDHEEARDDSLTLSAFPFSTGSYTYTYVYNYFDQQASLHVQLLSSGH